MKTRALSLLLVLCMLLALVPAIALTATAADGVTVKFVNANVNPHATVSTQTVTDINYDFQIPAVPADAFGWYTISPAGLIREASTYLGAPASEDVTFYLLHMKSSFSNKLNWPVYTSKTSLDAFRGGWTAGSYIANEYTLFNTVNAFNILENKGIWTYGGIYLSDRMVTQQAGMLALSYNAPISGEIDIDFDTLRVDANGDSSTYSDMAMAIAVNGTIVWPKAAAGTLVKNNPVSGRYEVRIPLQ